MNPIVYAIPVFMLTILVEAWLAHRRGLPAYDIPDALTSLHHGVVSQLTAAFSKLAALGIYVAVYQGFRATELPAGSVWVWLGALVAYDFLYYWYHRMGHEMNIIWASHVVHHSSEYYNLSTALRQTATGSLLSWAFYLPMAVAGVPPKVFIGVALIDLLYQYWVHTELVGRMGAIDRIMVTPSNHRVHHGQNDYCIDRNYGGIFIVWDRLFGTFEEERHGEKIVYGIRKPLRSFNPLWGNLHYYAELWRASMAAPGWRNKLGVWLAPPAGWTAPLPAFEPAAFSRFDTGTPRAVRWYVVLQYALVVPFISHFIAVAPHLTLALQVSYALGILFTVCSLGFLLEGRTASRAIEVTRLIALGLAFTLTPDWFGYTAPDALKFAMLAMLLASAAWVMLSRDGRLAGRVA